MADSSRSASRTGAWDTFMVRASWVSTIRSPGRYAPSAICLWMYVRISRRMVLFFRSVGMAAHLLHRSGGFKIDCAIFYNRLFHMLIVSCFSPFVNPSDGPYFSRGERETGHFAETTRTSRSRRYASKVSRRRFTMSRGGNSSSSSSVIRGVTLPTMVSKWASLATQTRWP